MSKIAIYAGSFDPFTNGHLDIVKQASKLFDTIYIVNATNAEKKRNFDINQMQGAIVTTLREEGIKNFLVVSSNMLISDLAITYKASYLIRGLRNTTDYAYEESIAKVNREINPSLNTIYFRANNEVISSSMVRELYSYGKDISKYVSPYVLEVMKNARG